MLDCLGFDDMHMEELSQNFRQPKQDQLKFEKKKIINIY